MQEMLRLAVLEILRAYDLKLEPCSSLARIRCSKATCMHSHCHVHMGLEAIIMAHGYTYDAHAHAPLCMHALAAGTCPIKMACYCC